MMQKTGSRSRGLQQLQQVGSAWALEQASIVVAHGLSCSMACGNFPEQGLNLCLLHWQGFLYH